MIFRNPIMTQEVKVLICNECDSLFAVESKKNIYNSKHLHVVRQCPICKKDFTDQNLVETIREGLLLINKHD